MFNLIFFALEMFAFRIRGSITFFSFIVFSVYVCVCVCVDAGSKFVRIFLSFIQAIDVQCSVFYVM